MNLFTLWCISCQSCSKKLVSEKFLAQYKQFWIFHFSSTVNLFSIIFSDIFGTIIFLMTHIKCGNVVRRIFKFVFYYQFGSSRRRLSVSELFLGRGLIYWRFICHCAVRSHATTLRAGTHKPALFFTTSCQYQGYVCFRFVQNRSHLNKFKRCKKKM